MTDVPDDQAHMLGRLCELGDRLADAALAHLTDDVGAGPLGPCDTRLAAAVTRWNTDRARWESEQGSQEAHARHARMARHAIQAMEAEAGYEATERERGGAP